MGCFTCGEEVYKTNIPIQPYAYKPPFTVTHLYQVLEDSNKIASFTIATGLFISYSVPHVESFPSWFGTAQFHSALYICGGLLPNSNEFSSKNIQIITAAQPFRVTERATMSEGKCSMGIRTISDCTFLVVGGYNEKVLSAVEQYNVNANEWISKGNLNIARYNSGVCTFSGRYIYVAGGCTIENNEEKLVRVIERCDMVKINVEWIIVPIYQSEWEVSMNFGFFQSSQTEILICGGYKDCITNEIGKNICLYDVTKGVIRTIGELSRNEVFTSGFYYGNENEMYGFGVTGSVYSYNARIRQWNDFSREVRSNEKAILINVNN